MRFKKDVYRNLAMITQLGISMLAPIILCVFIGYQLDARSGWSTTLPLLILGILAGCRNCWVLLKRLEPGNGQPKGMAPGNGQTESMVSGNGQPKGMAPGNGQTEKKGREDEPGS